MNRSPQPGQLVLALTRFTSAENGHRDNRRTRHHGQVGSTAPGPGDFTATAEPFGEDRQHLAGSQHLNRPPDGLRVYLAAVEGNLTDVGEKPTYRPGEGLPLYQGESQPP